MSVHPGTRDARLANRRSGHRVNGLLTGFLQRDPNSEEPEAPLVEPVVPHGVFLVAPVVDRATYPLPTGRRERPAPLRPRWCARSPRCGSVAPRGPVEVATLRISMPWAARCARGAAGVTRAARSAVLVAGSAGATVSVRPGSVRARVRPGPGPCPPGAGPPGPGSPGPPGPPGSPGPFLAWKSPGADPPGAPAGAPWPPPGAEGGEPGAAFAKPAPMPIAAAPNAPAIVAPATSCFSFIVVHLSLASMWNKPPTYPQAK